MKVSIIIPAYNVEKYIEQSIGCCLRQTYKDIEIVVVNDGSKDATSSIVRKLQQNDERIKLVEKPNGGLVSARKEGLKNITGEFVFFLDADDVIDDNTIEILAQHTDSYDIIIADFLLENESGKVLPLQHKNENKYGEGVIATYCNYLSKSIVASLCGRLFKASLFESFRTPVDVTIGEDVITNLLIVSDCNPKIKVVNLPLYHYIQYPTSMVNTKATSVLQKRVNYANWVVDFFEEQSMIDNPQIKSCLTYLLLDEYYSFLRDGGDVAGCSEFSEKINTVYWNCQVLNRMSVWKKILLKAYHKDAKLGVSVRYILNAIRKMLK